MSLLCWALVSTVIYSGVFSDEIQPYHDKWKQMFTLNILRGNELFGYSVAYQKALRELIVGSPRASKVGNIYTCPIGSVSSCTLLKVQVNANEYDFWLGATVDTGTDFIMACAPRFTDKMDDILNMIGTNGRCFSVDTKLKAAGRKLSMMSIISKDDKKQYHWKAYPDDANTSIFDYGSKELLMDSLGWSSHVTKDGSILVGGPAMSIGRAIIYDNAQSTPKLFDVENSVLERRNKTVSYNFGYSLTIGSFKDDDTWYAFSTPYGTYGNGRVLFYMKNQEEYKRLHDEVEGEVGSLFGAALCSMKTNETDALLVGAPTFARLGAAVDHEGPSYDKGALYVYTYSIDEEQFLLRRLLLGYKDGSYFGSAIASIGDQNRDSIDEVAVAAPYENEGRGAVYIYSGKQLLDDGPIRWLQRIVGDKQGSYLGWSLHAADDADDKGCNELAIGVPGNNTAMFYRCIASVNVKFQADVSDLKLQSKTQQTSSTSFKYEPCLKVEYSDTDIPNKIELETEILITISLHKHPNVTVQGYADGNVPFNAQLSSRLPQYCKEITVLLPKDGDYDYPIGFTMTAKLKQDPFEGAAFNPRLVKMNGVTSLTKVIPIEMLPSSNLTYKIEYTLKDGYVIGSTDNETLKMWIGNSGNTAFSPCIRVRVSGVSWMRYPRVCKPSGEWLDCGPDEPMPKNHNWQEEVTLNTRKLTSANEKLEVYAELLTHCMTRTGDPYNKTFTLKRDTNIEINGRSSPSSNVNVTRRALKDTGKHIEHIYNIINYGQTTWKDLVCKIVLPADVISFVYVGNRDCLTIGNNAHCMIDVLKKNEDTSVRVLLDIEPDSTHAVTIKKGKKITLETLFFMMVATEEKHRRINTVISLWEDPTVPLWIIVVAALVGLLVVVILAWILHECGCLRRNRREQLEQLRKEVQRQSMRKSMALRASRIEVIQNGTESSDRQKLVEVCDDIDDVIITESDECNVVSQSPEAANSAGPAPRSNPFTAELESALKKKNPK